MSNKFLSDNAEKTTLLDKCIAVSASNLDMATRSSKTAFRIRTTLLGNMPIEDKEAITVDIPGGKISLLIENERKTKEKLDELEMFLIEIESGV